MNASIPLFVLDKLAHALFSFERRAAQVPLRIQVSAAVVPGTSGAESALNDNAEAPAPTHCRARRGVLSGFLAAQLRRFCLETSRALLLLPPSLVRSGALRSDIYPLVTALPATARAAR